MMDKIQPDTEHINIAPHAIVYSGKESKPLG